MTSSSFLGLEGLHVFITGAAGGIGSEAVKEFLSQGCRVTGHDFKSITSPEKSDHFYTVQGDISSENSISSAIQSAHSHFGPINILIANAGITDEQNAYPIWELPIDLWEKVYATNIRGCFLTIKHFLRSAKASQDAARKEMDHLAVVVTGSECGKFGQEGHAEYGSGKAGLQYGLIRGVKNEIVRLNSKARINAVAPGWVDTKLIGDRLDDPKEMWAEAQATVPLKKIAKPTDVARAMAFLASHRAAGHISGECISVDGGMEGRLIWKEQDVIKGSASTQDRPAQVLTSIPPSILKPPKRKAHVAISVDFDAVSGLLGTGKHPDNNLSDFSAALFSATVGVPRLLKLFKKYNIADKVSWYIPGHSMESFPKETKDVLESGAEIGLHGYSHEGAYQMTVDQERDVLLKCIDLCTRLTGKKPVGYRAPLYQLRESTVDLLIEHGFEYDTSLNHHDSQPYYLPLHSPDLSTQVPDFALSASTWMHPLPTPKTTPLIEIPASWHTEDLTPLAFYPHTENSHGYVDVRLIERMWWDRFEWLWENEGEEGFIFPLLFHPEGAGRSHIIGMVERIIKGLIERGKSGDGEVIFETGVSIARGWKERHTGK